jgi:hypothetical protein
VSQQRWRRRHVRLVILQVMHVQPSGPPESDRDWRWRMVTCGKAVFVRGLLFEILDYLRQRLSAVRDRPERHGRRRWWWLVLLLEHPLAAVLYAAAGILTRVRW